MKCMPITCRRNTGLTNQISYVLNQYKYLKKANTLLQRYN